VIVGFVFLLFGIFGVNLLGGKLSYCLATDSTDISAVKTKADCDALQARGASVSWENNTYNWDNLPQAVMTLFYVVSLDGWVEIMYNGVDAVGVDMQPQQDHNEAMCLFFMTFLVVTARPEFLS
jgi:hypothetical protein